jgi:excisionase family DNA binding protein
VFSQLNLYSGAVVMTGQLLTAEQLAERWQVPTSHVYRLAREGRIPCVPGLGKYRRFRLDVIERFELGEESILAAEDGRA